MPQSQPPLTFLLYQADVGFAESVAEHLAAIPGVVEIHVTSGPYDGVAHVATDDRLNLMSIMQRARVARGLARLVACRPGAPEVRHGSAA